MTAPAPTGRSAILLLAYGGPDSLDDVPAFLHNVRGGRPLSGSLLQEITGRYRAIGGRSPLLESTRRVAGLLADRTMLPVYVGTRHWRPSIAEALAAIAAGGHQQVVVICMAPHYSALSIGAYERSLGDALVEGRYGLDIGFCRSWHLEPALISGYAEKTRAALSRLPAVGARRPLVVFTAHSLPVAAMPPHDPYVGQLHTTGDAIARGLGLDDDDWRIAFQSASRAPGEWLGPSVNSLLGEAVAEHRPGMVVTPVGFIADQMETLYDLDIALQAQADEAGLRLERTPALNDSSLLIDALVAVAIRQLDILESSRTMKANV